MRARNSSSARESAPSVHSAIRRRMRGASPAAGFNSPQPPSLKSKMKSSIATPMEAVSALLRCHTAGSEREIRHSQPRS